MKKPKPSSLNQQIKQARSEVWKMTPEQRATLKLQGRSEPLRGSVCIKEKHSTISQHRAGIAIKHGSYNEFRIKT